jgi:hypothetical protein
MSQFGKVKRTVSTQDEEPAQPILSKYHSSLLLFHEVESEDEEPTLQ